MSGSLQTIPQRLARRYIGDRAFYRVAISVSLPIMLQNFITNLVSMLDNLMVGSVGTEQMSAVSIVNQILFVYNLAVFGALSGAGIFTSQYFGRKDEEGIRYTFRYKLITGIALFGIATALLLLIPEPLINLYIHQSDSACDPVLTLGFARSYLRIMLLGLLPFALSQVWATTLRETGETVLPMVSSFVAVGVNCVFNYLLIFGKFGFPTLGVEGAAIATVLSRYVEFLILLIYAEVKKKRFPYLSGALRSLRIPKDTFSLIFRKGFPLLCNEFLWSASMSVLAIGYSLHGIEVVAGYSISSTVINLFSMIFHALGMSIGIIVGKQLGAGEFDRAVEYARKLAVFSIALSVVIGVITYFGGVNITLLYNTTPESKEFAAFFIRVGALYMPLSAYANSSYFTIRSGGQTIITMLVDSIFMWVVMVPTVFALYAAGLPIRPVYFITEGMIAAKCVIGFLLIRSNAWVRSIVEV